MPCLSFVPAFSGTRRKVDAFFRHLSRGTCLAEICFPVVWSLPLTFCVHSFLSPLPVQKNLPVLGDLLLFLFNTSSFFLLCREEIFTISLPRPFFGAGSSKSFIERVSGDQRLDHRTRASPPRELGGSFSPQHISIFHPPSSPPSVTASGLWLLKSPSFLRLHPPSDENKFVLFFSPWLRRFTFFCALALFVRRGFRGINPPIPFSLLGCLLIFLNLKSAFAFSCVVVPTTTFYRRQYWTGCTM